MQAERRTSLPESGFCGSYLPEDVTFLLKPVTLAPTEVSIKERLIQSGRHYSEMVAPETVPDSAYLALFHAAERRNRARLAGDVASLAAHMDERAGGREIVIVSLARAGTPIGVLLTRLLRHRWRPVVHYSISIIRDRGIDRQALAHIAARHDSADAVFVDGWTGKGTIAGELRHSLRDRPFGFAPQLAVIADPAGVADIAATGDDYLIASGLLNGIVSGLVSRSILNAELVGPGDFHACVTYPQFAQHDLSQAFVDSVFEVAAACAARPVGSYAAQRAKLQAARERMVGDVMRRAGTGDRNRVKPGIAEATRAFLRRVPERLFVRDTGDPDVAHLLHLAEAAQVPIELLAAESGYRAVAVIGRVAD